jgi:predicted  nucleic acid-binding Zn-ribbon protein
MDTPDNNSLEAQLLELVRNSLTNYEAKLGRLTELLETVSGQQQEWSRHWQSLTSRLENLEEQVHRGQAHQLQMNTRLQAVEKRLTDLSAVQASSLDSSNRELEKLNVTLKNLGAKFQNLLQS